MILEWYLVLHLLVADTTPESLVARLAVEAGISPSFCACIVQRESDWNTQAVGDGGKAVGLWQIHLGTWKFLRRKMGLPLDDLRHDPYEATRTAVWAIGHGYEKWWTTAKFCQKGKP